MKKSLSVLGILILITVVSQIIVACAMRKSEPVTQASFAPSKEKVRNGEIHYMQYCQKCHPAGEAGLGPSINANPAPGFLKRFQVRHGLGVMPPFKEGEISDKQLKEIMAYIKTWKRYD